MNGNDREKMRHAWEALCNNLLHAGHDVLAQTTLSPVDAAEGLRHLTRILRMNLAMEFEALDPDHPLLVASSTETQKAGYDCPDYVRLWTYIRGTNNYRLYGSLGDADLVSFMTYGPPPGGTVNGPLSIVSTGILETPHVVADEDGNFEVIVSVNDHGQNWLPMAPTSTKLAVRSVVHDRKTQAPARVVIEPLDSEEPVPPLSPAALAEGLESATSAFAIWAGRASVFTNRLQANGPNTFEAMDAEAGGGGSYPLQTYVYGYWELAPDEALLIDVDLPDCIYWNFHLCNHWAESLDYMRDRVTLNGYSADVGTDGHLQIVLASQNPRMRNWLNVAGRDHGTMVFRFLHGKDPQQPKTRVMPINTLSN
jgi:hypothetical protein